MQPQRFDGNQPSWISIAGLFVKASSDNSAWRLALMNEKSTQIKQTRNGTN
ncbi:hypothetical protein DPMN_130209 [Dreissena polymorpha]|uniref:Uncharacterized protein n=1 Tax=Dreissena polymorpha TaxID=45954 RepID=A0A9D4H2L6_DREPO|nr:hypothetical protein DPMN_130209 [Dreissena polymorpha]